LVNLIQSYKYKRTHLIFSLRKVKRSKTKAEEGIYTEPEHIYEEITFCLEPKTKSNETEVSVPSMEVSKPSGSSQRGRWVDITEVINSGLLGKLEYCQHYCLIT
jgi:hypothetical protein